VAQPSDIIAGAPGNPAITDDTRRTLDRYLALSVKQVTQDGEGYRYTFDLHCKECGGYQLNSPEGQADHHMAYCAACGIKMGMLGEVRAYAAEAAERHRDQPQYLADATPPQQRAKGLIWLTAAASLAAVVIFWPAKKHAVVEPAISLAAPVASTPIAPAPAAPAVQPPPPKPETVTAPLPPRRPTGI